MSILRTFARGWQARLHDIGNFQSRALLTVFYFTVLVPFGALTRVFADPLRLKQRETKTGWVAWDESGTGLDAARRQG